MGDMMFTGLFDSTATLALVVHPSNRKKRKVKDLPLRSSVEVVENEGTTDEESDFISESNLDHRNPGMHRPRPPSIAMDVERHNHNIREIAMISISRSEIQGSQISEQSCPIFRQR
eukprot:scaffold7025_cov123-Cylindrotheca_fusiformis.AAC.10